MFKRGRTDVGETDTLIGEGSVFEGKIQSKASIRIEGQLIGDIECDGDTTVGERGMAKSNITSRNIVIAGTVHGNVHARSALTLTSTAKLFGNASAQSLVVEEGAIFQGMSKMESKEAASGPASAPSGDPSSAARETPASPKRISAI